MSKLWLLTYQTTHYDDYDAKMNTSDGELKKLKNLSEQNFEGEANNRLLDEEDTQQSNLGSKYVSLALVLYVLIL